jgi:hypothetical protein
MANEVDKRARLQSAMSKAAKLMQLESNGTLDKIAAAHKDGINSSLDGEIMTEELMTTSRNRKTQGPIPTRQMGQNAANVPAAIREAFMANPIDDSALYDALGEQGDGRSLSFLTEGLEQPQPQYTPPQNVRQIVNEGMGQQYVQQPQVTQSIDYPMIRTIVEEIVRKYAVSLNKKIMNESKQETNEINTISLGKSFKFLAKNGDLYECTMKKVGNINDKKKSVNG